MTDDEIATVHSQLVPVRLARLNLLLYMLDGIAFEMCSAHLIAANFSTHLPRLNLLAVNSFG
jgi:hypothetical protein